jgi:hypothetical protein
MFVVSKKGIEKNGKNPTLLTGYGGFNVSLTPGFSRSMYLWMEHGGIYAVANLRGGAEFGEDWHRAGMLEKKAKRLRRLHRRRRISDRAEIHRQRSPRHSRRFQRRPADGRDDHAAPRSFPRRGLPGSAARHAALSELSDRQTLDSRVRLRRRSQAVRLALRLLALSSRKARVRSIPPSSL